MFLGDNNQCPQVLIQFCEIYKNQILYHITDFDPKFYCRIIFLRLLYLFLADMLLEKDVCCLWRLTLFSDLYVSHWMVYELAMWKVHNSQIHKIDIQWNVTIKNPSCVTNYTLVKGWFSVPAAWWYFLLESSEDYTLQVQTNWGSTQDLCIMIYIARSSCCEYIS